MTTQKDCFDDPQARLVRLRDQLLAGMEDMQAALPANAEGISEADERRARILTMMTRVLDVMSRLNSSQDKTQKGYPQTRNALLADIEQKLARLAAMG